MVSTQRLSSPTAPQRAWGHALGAARRMAASLKWRLVALTLLAMALAIVGITAVLVARAESDTLAARRHAELGDAQRAAALLMRRLVDLQRALQATADGLDQKALADRGELTQFLRSKSVLLTMFSAVVVAAPDGTSLARLDASGVQYPEQSLADRPHFRRTLQENRPLVSEPLHSRFTGEPMVVLTYPLRAAGRPVGVLLGALRLGQGDLLADLVDVYGTDSQALLVVTDPLGRILGHPDRLRLLQRLQEDPRFRAAHARWVDEGTAVEPTGLTLSERGDLITAAGVPGADWMVWRALPEAELLGPLQAARRDALAWAAGLVGLVAVSMTLLLGLALKPLRQLERRAATLFDGGQPVAEGWPGGEGEIGRLARVLRTVAVDRERLEAANAQALRRLQSVLAAAPVGIAFTRGTRLELVSAEMCRMFGKAEAELLAEPAHARYASPEEYQALWPEVMRAFESGRPYAGECAMQRADGSRFMAQLRGRPVDAADPAGGTIWSIIDVSGEVAARERLEWSATHDGLTGLANRQAFDTRLRRLFGERPQAQPAALIAIDLDHFKPINDLAGHAAGDAVLKAVAAAIGGCVRSNDLVARIGGDEFAVLLEHCGAEAVQRAAADIVREIECIALPWEGQVLRVGASVGVAGLSAELHDPEAWLHAADAACYAEKARRRTERGGAGRALRLVEGGSGAAA